MHMRSGPANNFYCKYEQEKGKSSKTRGMFNLTKKRQIKQEKRYVQPNKKRQLKQEKDKSSKTIDVLIRPRK